MELADHHIFTTSEQLKEEFKKNHHYIAEVLTAFNFQTKLVCALHEPNNSEKYHSDKDL
jgi:threonyl-tRNA synthetase